jgi:hypothetical protein
MVMDAASAAAADAWRTVRGQQAPPPRTAVTSLSDLSQRSLVLTQCTKMGMCTEHRRTYETVRL